MTEITALQAQAMSFLIKMGNTCQASGEFHMAYQGKGWFVIGPNKNGEITINKDGFSKKQDNFLTRRVISPGTLMAI